MPNGGLPGSIGKPLRLEAGSAKPRTRPHPAPMNDCTRPGTAMPFWEMIWSSASGCQKIGSCMVGARLRDDERLVHGPVARVGVVLPLERAVAQARLDHGRGDPVPERGGSVALVRSCRPGSRQSDVIVAVSASNVVCSPAPWA